MKTAAKSVKILTSLIVGNLNIAKRATYVIIKENVSSVLMVVKWG